MKKEHDVRIDRTKLHPWLDYKLTVLLKKCAKKKIYLIITEGFRTKKYQDQLYAKGRTKPGKVVTNAKGSTYSSQHMTWNCNMTKRMTKTESRIPVSVGR